MLKILSSTLATLLLSACLALAQMPKEVRPDKGAGEEWSRLIDQAEELYRAYKFEPALEVLKKSLQVALDAVGPEHPDVARSLNFMGQIFGILGDTGRSELMAWHSLSIQERTLGPFHPVVALTLSHLATTYYEPRGLHLEARALLERAHEILKRWEGPETLETARALIGVGSYSNEHGVAKSLTNRGLRVIEANVGPNNFYYSAGLTGLAQNYMSRGDFDKAESLAMRSSRILAETLGPRHPRLCLPLGVVANVCILQERLEMAEHIARHMLALMEQSLGPDHLLLTSPLTILGRIYKKRNSSKPKDSFIRNQTETILRRRLDLQERAVGSSHPYLLGSLSDLAKFYESNSDLLQGEALCMRAIASVEKTYGLNCPWLTFPLRNLASIYRKTDRAKEAAQLEKRIEGLEAREQEAWR